MQNTTRFKRLQHTLMLAFLLLSLIPLTLSSLFFLHSHTRDLAEQSTNHLASLRDNKRQQISAFFTAKESEIQSFVRSELANASGGRFYGIVGAFRQLGDINRLSKGSTNGEYFSRTLISRPPSSEVDNTSPDYIVQERYRLIYKRYHWAYEEYLKRSDFSDLLLVDLDGNVVYTSRSPDLFAARLGAGSAQYPALSQTYSTIKNLTAQFRERQSRNSQKNLGDREPEQMPIAFTDFAADGENREATAWFAAPIIQHGYLHSYAFFKLSNRTIADVMSSSSEANQYVQTLLIGQDHNLRLPNDGDLPAELASAGIDHALAGQAGVGSLLNFNKIPVLSAYAPIDVLGNKWALVVELPEQEAFSRIHQLEEFFLLAILAAVILVTITAHWLSNYITAPLLRLTWAAEQVSAGDLDQKITSTDRRDEIGRLAISFARMQRSIREKITLIREQNTELEHNLAVIQQQNEELQTADKLKDEFLATTSHELRTPLHGMVGIAEAMLAGANGPIQPDQQRQLDMIISSGQRLTKLVDDLLDYHKMRYGDLDIQPHAVDLAAANRLVLELSAHLLDGKPVRIINQIPADLPLVIADEQRLEQILYNLVGNAIKYTSEGKIILSATVLESQVRIQVVDTGQGIPAEQLEHIFEPLVQANTGSANYHQGAGLGLSISRQLIELMGGSLYVSSQPMIGTTFSFILPLATKEDIARSQLSTPQHDHFQAPRQDANTVNIDDLPDNPDGEILLVVDDEPVNLQVVTSFLRIAGYRVITAENGQQALSLMEAHQPSLVLLDVMMPGMSGYEVCQQLRTRYSLTELPIIMLSALGQVRDRVKGFEFGANDYLTKPFNKDELTARIRAHLQAAQTERQRTENQWLQQEIRHREQVQLALLDTQTRLLGLLESTSEAILCTREDGRIRYANNAAGQLFQRAPEQLERLSIQDLLLTQLPEDIEQNRHYSGELSYRIQDGKQTLATDLIQLPAESGLSQMFIFDSQGPSSVQRIALLENAVDVLSGFATDGDKHSLQRLRDMGGEFSQLADRLDHSQPDKADQLRQMLVDVMKDCLQFWEASTGKTKFDLAEESGLWRVYLDRSTLQTRTLDKYLQLETLPKTPRWRTVLNTLDFVLERCAKESRDREAILEMRNRLQRMISQ
ncbi:response regulator [Photobacterium sp. 2_MG-2023]|uniref:hybrid sensor histidine kinase/response regulator n=1 Tax=Photobacterium sp. 2_MG-2023 TaxID=3062663 RepID=UPI0026E307DA|nr:response regulator [Photobacterium sp. 2_MG-2023]MDO6580330.1 response regulator [Photobacterium sp. 2_MG-2023]